MPRHAASLPPLPAAPPATLASRLGRRALLAGLGLAPLLAHATVYICEDGEGHRFRIAQRIETRLIEMRCTEEASLRGGAGTLSPEATAVIRMPRVVAASFGPRGVRRGRAAPASAKSSSELDALIQRTAQEFGHDPSLLKAIVHVESGFNSNAVSPKGAIGLMQLIPSTAARYGLSERRQLFEPGINLRIGAQYLADLKRRFANRLDLILAAYNAGEGAVEKYRNTIPPYEETQSYVRSVLAAYADYRR